MRLSPHQVAFHVRHAEIGCPTYVLVLAVPFGKTASKDGRLLLYRGDQVLELAQSGIDTTPLASWSYGMVPWNLVEFELMNS